MPLLLVLARAWKAEALMAARLLPHGLVSLLGGVLVRTPPQGWVGAALPTASYALAVVLALAWGTAAERRVLLASLVITCATYSVIVLGRAGLFYQALGQERSLLEMTSRYHYEASAALAISVCVILRVFGHRCSLPSVVRTGLVVVWLLALVLAFTFSGWRIDHHDRNRQDIAAALAGIRRAVEEKPPGSL
jgi:hypothetical protein